MAPEAAPAAGLQGIGAEHASNDIQERGHSLPTAGGIKYSRQARTGLTYLLLQPMPAGNPHREE